MQTESQSSIAIAFISTVTISVSVRNDPNCPRHSHPTLELGQLDHRVKQLRVWPFSFQPATTATTRRLGRIYLHVWRVDAGEALDAVDAVMPGAYYG